MWIFAILQTDVYAFTYLHVLVELVLLNDHAKLVCHVLTRRQTSEYVMPPFLVPQVAGGNEVMNIKHALSHCIAGIKTFSGTGMKRGRFQSHLLVATTALSWDPLPPDASLHEGLTWTACTQHV